MPRGPTGAKDKRDVVIGDLVVSESSEAKDLFAAIAGQRQLEQAGLITPQPPRYPENILPVQRTVPTQGLFEPRGPMTAAGLTDELDRLRDRMAPFLQDLAPQLPRTRLCLSLESFQWREETDDDRRHFDTVLKGEGRWETVRIPHYGGPLGRAVTYYRTSFEVTSEMQNKDRLFACFKGVDYKAHVFINGSLVGSHEGFFAPFEFDITAYARRGENVLVVKVENDAICMGNDSWDKKNSGLEGDKIYAATGPGYDDPEIGWHHCPPGMGIYQGVSIEARSGLFVHDEFVRPLPDEDRVEVWLELWNCNVRRQPARLMLSVFGQNFAATVCEAREFELPGPLGPRVNYCRFNVEMPDHRTWEPDEPWLYQLQVRLLDQDGELLDTAARQFGMRSFSMDTESEPRGRMYLNGREIRLRGANTMGFEQQDVMKQDWNQLIDDILLAKLCNMNFWRLTQRPVQAEIYDYCDRLGLMTQTDLPLFGKMRRNQFAEGVRQAGEMEQLVRGHPCNIMVTYINEPFPSAWGLDMWRHLSRPELESFFLACDQAVRLQNPDRVIKAVEGDYDPPGPGLPDLHCYCGWYNGHGLDIGRLHRGYWQPVQPGWMYGCGEFGAEGLEDADLMRRRYPKQWLPQSPAEEKSWSPDSIVKAQTGRFGYMWFDTQHLLDDWVEASQGHQAWATRIMTEAFRRDSRMNSFAIHLFIDAFPSGWMKAIMDVERRPKPAFFVYREALTSLMVNLRTDRFVCFGGETAELEAWICNDTQDQPEDTRLAYRIEVNGKATAGGWSEAVIPICSSVCQGRLRFDLASVAERGVATVRIALLGADGEVLHDAAVEINVLPRPAAYPADCPMAVIGAPDGTATTLARNLECQPQDWQPSQSVPATILIDDLGAAIARAEDLQATVRQGAVVIILDVAPGEHVLLDDTIEGKACGMGPVQFVSRDTGHPLVADFGPDDFRFWYDGSVGYPTPLLDGTFTAEGWTPILSSGNGLWRGDWGPALAAAEKRDGDGAWRICNVKLAGRIEGNPVAEIFARRLLNLETAL